MSEKKSPLTFLRWKKGHLRAFIDIVRGRDKFY